MPHRLPTPDTPEAACRDGAPSTLRRALLLGLLGCAVGCGFSAASVRADSFDERRVRMGARLFRGTLAADVAVESKAVDGRLQVLLYSSSPQLADEISQLIAPTDDPQQAQVRGIPVDVRRIDRLPTAGDSPAAMYLASPPSAEELDRLIAWSIESGVMLYSPFEGHVERGVMIGLSIEANVRMFINPRSLQAGGIELKPLLLKSAKAFR